MKILMENFRDEKTTNIIREQYSYLQEQQKREEDALRNAVIKKQRGSIVKLALPKDINSEKLCSFSGWQTGQVLENMKVRTEIKKISLTLYLGETQLVCFYSIFLIYNIFLY